MNIHPTALLLTLLAAVLPNHQCEASTHRKLPIKLLTPVIQTLGVKPKSCSVRTRNVKVDKTLSSDKFGTITKIHFTSCGEQIYALLAVPRGANTHTPAVIALHQTSNAGMKEVMGMAGDPGLSYGLRFYKAGLVVIAPQEFIDRDNSKPGNDWSTAPFYQRYPDWSAMGQMLADHEATVDALFQIGRHPSCLSVVGHSLGGHNALFLAAFDHRLDAAVSSGGFELISDDREASRWARESWFTYMPLLRPYVQGPPPHSPPWDFDTILKAIAPRSVLIVQGTRDEMWTHPLSAKHLVDKLKRAHIFPSHALKVAMFNGPHSFPPRLQNAAIKFVRKVCKRNQSATMNTSTTP